MSQIRYIPMGPGRYRKIFRKKKASPRRKPLGPPVRFPSKDFDFAELASGAGVEARMDAMLEERRQREARDLRDSLREDSESES